MDRLEIKAAITVDDAGTITGMAWPFGSADSSNDIITKGAFTFAVAQESFRCSTVTIQMILSAHGMKRARPLTALSPRASCTWNSRAPALCIA